MIIINKPTIIKFVTSAFEIKEEGQNALREIVSSFYSKSEIKFESIDQISEHNLIYSLITVCSDDKEDTWSVYLQKSLIPHYSLIFMKSKIRNMLDDPITSKKTIHSLVNDSKIDIFIDYKDNSLIRKLFPISLVSSAEGLKVKLYIYEKIQSIGKLSRFFEQADHGIPDSFFLNIYNFLLPNFENENKLVKYKRTTRDIKRLFDDFDKILADEKINNKLDEVLKPYSIRSYDWLHSIPFEGLYWRDE